MVPRTGQQQSGFSIGSDETPTSVTPSEEFDVRVHVTSAEPWTTGGPLKLAKTWLESQDKAPWKTERLGAPGLDTPSSNAGDAMYRVTVPRDAAYTRPYFTRPSPEQPFYDISDPKFLNLPFAPYPLAGWAEFSYDGVPLQVGQVVQTNHREHGYGNLLQPLVVTPRISVSLGMQAGIVPLGTTSFPLTVSVKNYQQETADGTLRLTLPAGWTAEPAAETFHLPAGTALPLAFTVHPDGLSAQSYDIKAVAQSGNYEFGEGVQTVGYPGLRPYFLYKPATYVARGVDVKVAPGLNVGYVMGTGDEVPEALEQIGIRPHMLSAVDLAGGDLSRYNAIVIGIRAYANRPDLAANNPRLLEYVKQGGVVIVQYQSPEYDHNYGPYPYALSRNAEKVVDETDPVTFPDAAHPLFAWPNRITPADFDGWEEERGHGFMQSWDAHYTALTQTADPGQDPQRGGLLYARYGKGVYIYAAYALYRQFPAAVPGAYRILANLVSLGENPGLTQH
jgi:hypothetical protein